MRSLRIFAAAVPAIVGGLASAEAATPSDIRASYAQAAKLADPAFQDFSAQRGERLFRTVQGAEWSCSSCHTHNPVNSGKHAKTGKTIAALAPVANPERFTDPAKVEKWFKRNCNDVLNRSCTAIEKGDVMTYLMSLGK